MYECGCHYLILRRCMKSGSYSGSAVVVHRVACNVYGYDYIKWFISLIYDGGKCTLRNPMQSVFWSPVIKKDIVRKIPLGHVDNIPTKQFFTGISRNPQSYNICYDWLSVSGISKMMHCGRIMSMRYLSYLSDGAINWADIYIDKCITDIQGGLLCVWSTTHRQLTFGIRCFRCYQNICLSYPNWYCNISAIGI